MPTAHHGHLGSHLAVTQDKLEQHGEDRLASRALNAPDGEPAEPNPSIMGMAGQTPTTGTGRFVQEPKSKGEVKGENKLDKCLAIIESLKIGGLIVKIKGDGAVLTGRFDARFHVLS